MLLKQRGFQSDETIKYRPTIKYRTLQKTP